jgi:hypothetical protein
MTVRPWSETQSFADGQKRPRRHQLDYTIHWPELWSVDFPAASWNQDDSAAGDASSASLLEAELRAVLVTAAPATSVT